MKSVTVEAFFSCSFRDEDKEVNDYFLAICRGLDINPVNVSIGYSKLPAEKAREILKSSGILVAVCVKRHETKNDENLMPQAVRDEITMAYSLGVPTLIIFEQGVTITGFLDQYGTRLEFKRSDIKSNEFLAKSVASIHGLKLEAVSNDIVSLSQDDKDLRAEFMRHRVELVDLGNARMEWRYSTAKRVEFLGVYAKGVPHKIWAASPLDIGADALQIDWEAKTLRSSRSIEVVPEIRQQSAECVDAILRFEPTPEQGDYVEYSTVAKSPHINPIWAEDVKPGSGVHLGAENFIWFEGVVPVQRTKKLYFEMRLPACYGISKSQIRPFVGNYTSGIDYEVESEIERATVTIDDIGGDITVRIETESPLTGHMYGVAWNPPSKPIR